jgi:hypothetical protein
MEMMWSVRIWNICEIEAQILNWGTVVFVDYSDMSLSLCCHLARFQENPLAHHLKGLFQVIQYVKKTRKKGLVSLCKENFPALADQCDMKHHCDE